SSTFPIFFFLLPSPLHPRSTLFPYTTLFRSVFQGSTMVDDVNDFLDRAVSANKESGIVSMFMMARDFVADENGNNSAFLVCAYRSEEHTSELQSRFDLVCRLLLEKKKQNMKE